jgi:hypothetical protein
VVHRETNGDLCEPVPPQHLVAATPEDIAFLGLSLDGPPATRELRPPPLHLSTSDGHSDGLLLPDQNHKALASGYARLEQVARMV